MNEKDKLRPDDNALRLFFQENTLYLPAEQNDLTEDPALHLSADLPLENPATPVFEGRKNAELMMIFSHNSKNVLVDDWGAMVSGLIQNERAMNLKLDQLSLVNLRQNPNLTIESLFTEFAAKKVLVWGKTGDLKLDALSEFESGDFYGKTIFKLREAANYLSKEAKVELWQFIKGHILT